jgi:hypothetical protein
MPSAVIKSYQYDAEKEIFEVIYHSGKVYHYLQVPESEYRQFKATIVKGIWFNRHIKGKYAFREVTPGLNQNELFQRSAAPDQHQATST